MIITGALSYSGRYIAARAHEQGWQLHTLEGNRSANKPNPLSIPLTLFDWEDPQHLGRIEEAMQGCDVFVNTYWRRPTAGERACAIAEHHSYELFAAAQRSGVKRIVHLSVAHAQEGSSLPYFHHKGRVENALKLLGIPATVLRPALLFGDSPEESILMNNWAWCLRHSPIAGLIGDGAALIHPLHVRDLAEMVMQEASREEGTDSLWNTYAAVGEECLSLRQSTEMLISAMKLRHRRITPIPASVARHSASLFARIMGGVRLFEKEEIDALLQGKLAYSAGTLPVAEQWYGAAPKHRLSSWLMEYGEQLGRKLV